MKNKNILSKMSISEKIDLCCGLDFWRSVPFEQYGIPKMTVADGPHGIRYQGEHGEMEGIHDSKPATCFPTAVTTGCSWDVELIGRIASAITSEARAYGVDTVLGPGLNIKRNPLCGRNFEYFSEDPYLSGKLGAAFVKAGQRDGIGTCIKHFAANSQEYKRFSSNDFIDERTLREIYLPAFEMAVKEGQPAMVMSAYNKINGTYCSDNGWLLSTVLRDEWGFEGMVVSDWGGTHDRVAAFKAGCDWSMPGGSRHLQRHALRAFQEGLLTENDIDCCADRILTRIFDAEKARKATKAADFAAHQKLARQAAVESGVLLKNDEDILPLKTDAVALLGLMAENPRYQGSGSSHITPTQLTSLRHSAPHWSYAPGYDLYGDTDEARLQEAAQLAAAAEVCVVVCGLPDSYESESFDRKDMHMPEGHVRLIEAAAAVNANTVVVLLCGSPVTMPWLDKVKAVLYMGLSGQAGAAAALDLLTGVHCPGGKLAETWPLEVEDVPCSHCYGEPHKDAQYQEGLYVGYRYYDKAKQTVRFPFGFGLSYTSFEYKDLMATPEKASVTITNTGDCAGAEIVQLYIAPPKIGPHRPVKELKGFAKVFLEPGESKTISFALDNRSFALWNDGWQIQEGRYTVLIGASCLDIRLSQKINLSGIGIPMPFWQPGSWYETLTGHPTKDDLELLLGAPIVPAAPPQRGQFTMENTIEEMAEKSPTIRLIKNIMVRNIIKIHGEDTDPRDNMLRMSLSFSIDCALFSLVLTSNGSMTENMALALVDIANGKRIRGFKRLRKKDG